MAEIKNDFNDVINVIDFLKYLFDERKSIPFYNEEDFRFAFAYEIKKMGYDVTLEYPRSPVKGHIDLVVWEDKETTTPIALFEFKYKTYNPSKTIQASHGVTLTDESAQNDNRFRFFQDIEKLENDNRFNAKKYCIFLTNDGAYMKGPNSSKDTADRELRINNDRPDLNREGKKELTYYKNPPKTVTLTGKYTFNWKTYTGFGEENPFYYLVVDVK